MGAKEKQQIDLAEQAVLRSIAAYEIEVGMPPAERVTRVVQGLPRAAQGNWVALTPYAFECREWLDWCKQVDLVVKARDKNPDGRYENISADALLVVSTTPPLLGALGADNKPFLYTFKHCANGMRPKHPRRPRWHGLTVEQMKRLPEYLAHPVAVVDSPTRKDSVVAILPTADADGNPLVAAVCVDNGHGQRRGITEPANFIASVYGKERFEGFLQAAVRLDNVLYVNKEKSQLLPPDAKLRLLGTFESIDSCRIIHPHDPNHKTYADGDGSHSDDVGIPAISPSLTNKGKETDKAARFIGERSRNEADKSKGVQRKNGDER